MPSIIFDGTEIVTTTHVPRFIKHESAPIRDLALMDFAKEDGAVLVSEKYGRKTIIVSGTIKASTQSNLETAIDAFKLLFSGVEKNLDIGWAGGTRRYVATAVRHDFDRDHMHIGFVPWTAEFVVPLGVGKDTSETTLVNASTFQNDAALNAPATETDSMSFEGSAAPQPRIRIKVGATDTDIKGVAIKNVDTGERIVMTRAAGWTQDEYFEIDVSDKTAEYNGVAIDFYGVFPTWVVGANNYEIRCASIVDQQFTDTGNFSGAYNIFGTTYAAMSFTVPYTDTTYQGIGFFIRKVDGGSMANLDWEIVDDDGSGAPDVGSAVANANGQVAAGDVDTSFSWIDTDDANIGTVSTNAFTLNANTRYWLVLNAAADGGDATNKYEWRYASGSTAVYKRGNAATSADSGSSWTDAPTNDLFFKVYYGGKGGTQRTFTYDVFYKKAYL